jgi:hypothetical protein
MKVDERISLLEDFKSKLLLWRGKHEASARSFINQNLVPVRQLVIDAGCFHTMTIGPPPAIGGPILQGVDPFGAIFNPPYRFDMVQKVVDIIDQTIGVLNTIPIERIQKANGDLRKPDESLLSGDVVARLKWDSIDEERFERLLFSLISQTPGYENPQWLTKTNASDRGRDLSVTRTHNDPLGGTIRQRVIIQCKHWLSKSVSLPDIAGTIEQMKLWEPPRVDILIVATSGRFTSDAIQYVEKHNQGDKGLRVEMWPESHLERLLASRPALIAEFGLR